MHRQEPETPSGVGKMQYERPMPERMMAIEVQMERFLTDIEKEEEAREEATRTLNDKLDRIAENQERANQEFREQQNRTNRIIWMMVGGLTVFQVVLQFIKH